MVFVLFGFAEMCSFGANSTVGLGKPKEGGGPDRAQRGWRADERQPLDIMPGGRLSLGHDVHGPVGQGP